MNNGKLILGTRGSPLALVQTRLVREALIQARPDLAAGLEVIVFGSRGDSDRSCAIEHLGGRGIFTDELDQAVNDGAVDLAIHSVKDLPVPLPQGLLLTATLEREDAREAFVSTRYACLADVPRGGVLGSASVRRQALVKALRPDLSFGLLRGNVDERIAALDALNFDGTILAVTGLKRLGLERHIREILAPETLMPDPGQGAVGLVSRADNANARLLAARINHAPTLQAVMAERAFLRLAGGRFVVGALATVNTGVMALAGAAHLHGQAVWRGQAQADTPLAAAHKLAASLPMIAAREGSA